MPETPSDFDESDFDKKVAALEGAGKKFEVVSLAPGVDLSHPAGPRDHYMGQLKSMSGGGRGCVTMIDYLPPKGPRCLLQAVPSR